MTRTERLLDLVALLLDAREPVSWAAIRETFPEEYGAGADEAAERKFERDKAELLELGLPITYQPVEGEAVGGYVLDKEAYYLPELGLAADELAVLYAAGSAALASGAFPGSSDLARALQKIGFFADAPLPAPKVRLELDSAQAGPALGIRLDALWAAVTARKQVTLTYFSPHTLQETTRLVDPYGLALRRGVWNLVGHCHLRGAPRTFLVHRIRSLEVNPARPRTPDFEVPASFQLEDYVATWPWQHRFHEPVKVEVELSGELAARALSVFPGPQETAEGRALVEVAATDVDGLLRYLLSLGPEAKVVSPASVQARLVALASRLVADHGGGP